MPIIEVREVSHRYPPARRSGEERYALRDITFSVEPGSMFALLGPNGSGKSTLFRLLATLTQTQSGTIVIDSMDVGRRTAEVRRTIGVVFQHPALDGKLTARENLMHQGHLYGLRGAGLSERIEHALSATGISDRSHDLVESYSGGMRRKVELAKALLHRPKVLILDEPTTGLDPVARRDFSRYLISLRETEGTTVLLTTHVLEEADEADTIAIVDRGRLVAHGSPQTLKSEIGAEVITVECEHTAILSGKLSSELGITAIAADGALRIDHQDAAELIPRLLRAFPDETRRLSVSKPTLEDVFVRKTGRGFDAADLDGGNS